MMAKQVATITDVAWNRDGISQCHNVEDLRCKTHCNQQNLGAIFLSCIDTVWQPAILVYIFWFDLIISMYETFSSSHLLVQVLFAQRPKLHTQVQNFGQNIITPQWLEATNFVFRLWLACAKAPGVHNAAQLAPDLTFHNHWLNTRLLPFGSVRHNFSVGRGRRGLICIIIGQLVHIAAKHECHSMFTSTSFIK